MNVAKCDKCKKVGERSRYSLSDENNWLRGDISGSGLRFTFDLCDKCNKKLVAYLIKYFGEKIKEFKI